MKNKNSSVYKPFVRTGVKIDGITGETIPNNASGKIIQKSFITSYDKDFEKICNNLLNLVAGGSQDENLNQLVVVIDKTNQSLAYKLFPFRVQVRLKKSKKALEVVFQEDIIDIEGIEFADAVFNLPIQNGDKFIWLFRSNWKFGLFFDFSGRLDTQKLPGELALCYKRLKYLDLYRFLENHTHFAHLLADGWFPFIQITGKYFQNLMEYYADGKQHEFYVEQVLNYFDREKVKDITANWWKNPVFKEKQEIIEAGIDAYFQETSSGCINAIRTLSTEIEGVVRIMYFRDTGKNPNTQDIKEYLKSRGTNKFSSDGSLGFPGLFYEYLNQSIFKQFRLESNDVPSSRHSYAHGVATPDNYTKARALQLILTLDQIYFFLG